jgi:hypothetical protein
MKPETTREELVSYIETLPDGQAEWWYFAKQIEWLCNKIDELKNAG